MEIKTITQDHFSEVAEIYRQGLATGIATFQNEVPSWEEWDRGHLAFCRIAVSENDKILGWAALTPASGRSVYAGVAEVSIYIAEEERGKGIGTLLLNELIGQSEANGIWTLQSGIFSENKGSIRLHEKCGFRQVGYRERIAKKNGIWKDTVFMERRSKIVGTD
ncbi:MULTISPECIES: GNAT family N-acetyltransferase [Chryseobacterium]|uniref:L-amino acid N-acyltransferase YncA n=1 Tax=Chryseobacterium camelliae TaxID=1265445 RepID=A0ABU0THZ7_9FLAO|nr:MULTISPECIES: GNAT family N-acetyltransferase [Chryseobacterium]MDT3406331.1 L-amino acid N-acyltransferase YncA [Pseudacidovorax intermedius]MDQ1095870.1 L-amino acid N-acyltransferase YncA [Chryseobacterium camelliae]MDQ1099807.1 L-amino acid N-acyltransferase YncA [Chryseobacterium sp. SORGH_AS_1048]MDR6087153.1 L-amino acid N-acyltransferase YncA [Chryseobacterium sp. SORGH_AS_0909]MDR6131526.1 L-amino acid N-acyltransferase YncA [Chryseobacterium sp. SORGH_AS_1175]